MARAVDADATADRRRRRHEPPRVAITGIGLVTALGATREDSVGGADRRARAASRPVTVFDTEGYRSRVAAEVPMAPIDARLTPLERRRWSRGDQHRRRRGAPKRSRMPGCSTARVDRSRVGVFLGAGTARSAAQRAVLPHTAISRGIEHARPSDAWNHFSSTPVDVIAARFGFEGPRCCVVAACSSSTIAIGQAADAIRTGRLDAALAGGTDALARLTFSGFNALRLMDPEPCRPFDRSRAGMNIGEGAGILVLEEMERARRARRARSTRELAGYELRRARRFIRPRRSRRAGRSRAVVAQALRDAGARRRRGRSHQRARHRDAAERSRRSARAPRGVRRAQRADAGDLVKSMIGHCLGAAGAIEAAVLALTVARGVIPPTIHHGETDPECPVDVVANDAREQRIRCGVSTSLGFGGNDSAVVIRAV